ncbi:hypothetical protein FB45DRAFT_1034760 [Roridomyces roridus]|uniref:Uncharacterized protein n=1 Tax=Roridomyces roridus TaxID=1738132 RepID=A0AAD7BBE7_9AGAR|nr:hypothetical protein FB45DRAFT_1034760 [Roridomyces roridus]
MALGQGFVMCLEDAVALGVLVPAGTPRSEIAHRLEDNESLRKERAEYVSKESYEQQQVAEKRVDWLKGAIATEMRDRSRYDVRKEAERVLDDFSSGSRHAMTNRILDGSLSVCLERHVSCAPFNKL